MPHTVTEVFLSSTYVDLVDHRAEVASVVRRMPDFRLIAMEDFGSSSTPPMEFCVKQVHGADIYLGLIGWRYGYVDPQTRKSATEIEYRTALSCDIPLLLYLLADDYPIPANQIDTGDNASRIRALREEIKTSHTVQFFREPTDVAARVATDLHRQIDGRSERKRFRRIDKPVDYTINPHHPYCLVHTVRPSRRTISSGDPYHNVRIYLDVYSNEESERRDYLKSVDRVVYQLHECFPFPVMVQQNWADCFRLDLAIWGEFWIQATVFFKDSSRQPIQLIRLLTLGDAEPICEP